jgi:hypothetical protein
MGSYEPNGHVLMSDPRTVWCVHRVTESSYIPQEDDWSCGPATIRMMLRVAELPDPGNTVLKNELHATPRSGSSTRTMEEVLRARSSAMKVRCEDGASLELLRDLLREGWIIAIQFREPEEGVGHYALVEGISPHAVQFCDPMHGRSCVLRIENLDWSTQFEEPMRIGWYVALKP